jgi:lipopolysaccharide/colanic/teichoic acid biosynthesis glycosyltransferase
MMAKRLFDLFFSLTGLLLLAPLFAVAAVWIKLDSSGPVFFRQVRVGRFEKLFRIFKFRTMCVDAEAKGRQITVGEDPRITRSGRFLRRYKLDELPQLLNVVKGEMSLVGPRPEVPRYVEFYPEILRAIILSVPPGITDFASIEYKDENAILGQAEDPDRVYITEVMPVKLNYCERYVEEQSLWIDAKLIIKTFKALVRGRKPPPSGKIRGIG